jgi:hypothetical protein
MMYSKNLQKSRPQILSNLGYTKMTNLIDFGDLKSSIVRYFRSTILSIFHRLKYIIFHTYFLHTGRINHCLLLDFFVSIF